MVRFDDVPGGQSLARARAQWRSRWYAEGHYQHRDLGAIVDEVLRGKPNVSLLFEREGVRNDLRFDRLRRDAAGLAVGLRHRGLSSGDRILVQLPHCPESLTLLVACLQLGLVTVPVPTAAGDADVAVAITGSGAKLVVLIDVWRGRTYGERLAGIESVAPGVVQDVLVAGSEAPTSLQLSRCVIDRAPAGELGPRPDADAEVARLFTSGSTGDPKGVRHSHNSLLAEVRTGWAALSGESRRTTFVPLPPGHVGGVISALIPLVTGRAAAFLEPWSSVRAARLLDDTDATIVGAVPFFLLELIEQAESRGRALGSLHYCNVGGAGVPPVLIERADAIGIRAGRAYGLTEHPTVSSGAADDALVLRATSDGRVAEGSRVRIVDGSGVEVPSGTEGEIVTVGPDLMLGYTDPQRDADAHLPGGWFRTGDLGTLRDGVLTVTGRLKDLVIRGGVNISVGPIEAALARSPRISDVAVVGVPDERLGERLLAVVVPTSGSDPDLDHVRRLCAETGIARIATPEFLNVVDALPRGATGKVLRARLAKDWTEATASRARRVR